RTLPAWAVRNGCARRRGNGNALPQLGQSARLRARAAEPRAHADRPDHGGAHGAAREAARAHDALGRTAARRGTPTTRLARELPDGGRPHRVVQLALSSSLRAGGSDTRVGVARPWPTDRRRPGRAVREHAVRHAVTASVRAAGPNG